MSDTKHKEPVAKSGSYQPPVPTTLRGSRDVLPTLRLAVAHAFSPGLRGCAQRHPAPSWAVRVDGRSKETSPVMSGRAQGLTFTMTCWYRVSRPQGITGGFSQRQWAHRCDWFLETHVILARDVGHRGSDTSSRLRHDVGSWSKKEMSRFSDQVLR